MNKQVIAFHYTLTDKSGKKHDSSLEGEPMTFLEGSGQIIPGLEKVLIGLAKGTKKQIQVPYQEAYGAYDQGLIYAVNRDKFKNEKISVGDIFQIGKGNSYQVVTVIDLNDDKVSLDANHPLAGKDLTFEIEITDKRDATTDELAHGHVHGHGGHHH